MNPFSWQINCNISWFLIYQLGRLKHSDHPFVCPASIQPEILSSIQFLVNKEVYSHHRHSICSWLKNCTQTEFINSCWYLNLESELQLAWFCSLLVLKTCFNNIFFEFETRQPQTIIVEHPCLHNRSYLLKNFETSIRNLSTSPPTPRRAADLLGRCRCRRPKLTGAPPPTQWHRRRALEQDYDK